ncbi:phenolphthiocerol/phthiocerol polyketide synthase subunit B-like [Ostrea edulis]|uniref:phenolphthiocerol/phthiocerol polyketide synthase subunit B-like n=1 Tax=Ostrea edulis TaxID=37623 RepID=UPI0024AEDC3C|nr:phenolphthiocerol/phthiocerol polyketide synthase subunit B-like [Ostrea edulis]
MDGDDAIAIVGIGCKFPGAENLDEFWRVLANGEDHVKDIPKDRYDVEAYYDSDPDAPGKSYIRKAGLVSGINEWDKMFFGKGDNEAKRMDPQQRLVLECVYKAMEDGGITKANLDRSETGVYIGEFLNSFGRAMLSAKNANKDYMSVPQWCFNMFDFTIIYFF